MSGVTVSNHFASSDGGFIYATDIAGSNPISISVNTPSSFSSNSAVGNGGTFYLNGD